MPPDPARQAETARLLLEAARYLGETLDPTRVYERFREILAEAIPHDGVIVSSFDPEEEIIRCEYAWVEGELLDVSIFPPLRLQATGGMQSEVIRTGLPLLTNDVPGRVRDSGTYYDVDSAGRMRKVPDEGPPKAQAALMLPVKHEGRVVGVVQLMTDSDAYDETQLELAEGMVAQLGAAVRNARLHEEALRAGAEAAAARAAARERERAAQVLEAVGDGIFSVDDREAIGFWNRAAEAITGMPADAVHGRTLAELGGGWATLTASVAAAGADERPRAVTLPIDVDGRELWLSFVAVRTQDGVVYAFRDMTFERQFEESKYEFVATVSHELRTPMTAVLGAANTLLRDDIELSPETARQLLEMIATQATRLSEVTESVLLAGRLDRDEVDVERTQVDVDAVVGQTVDALEPNLPSTVRVERSLGAPGAVFADANRLQQVLINLLDNAAKYSPNGGTITVRTARAEGRVAIEVSDEGAGIDAADRERIFEKFFRAEESSRLVPGGTGLGLYICRELLERMGGTIRVDSSPGAASTFTVELAATAR
jgi:PAS domain S-box-containing protein